MKKSIYLLTAALMLSSFAFVRKAYATHVAAAEITYEYMGISNQYRLTLKAYRDCTPGTATMGTTQSVCYSSASLPFSSSVTLTLLPGSGQQIPPSPCFLPGAPFQCYEEYIYQGIVNLPNNATDWTFSWELCCRNGAINTIANPLGVGMAVTTTLNSIVAPGNSSPTFSAIPILRYCVGNQYSITPGASDINGDSVSYALLAPEDASTICPIAPFPLNYVTPYSPTNPFATTSGFGFNPVTGIMTFQPSLIQVGVLSYRVFEFRQGQLIGTIKRDIQVNILGAQYCNAQLAPVFANTQVLPPPAPPNTEGIIAHCGDSTIIISFMDNIQCGSAVPTDFRATDPTGFPNPIINVNPINCTNSLTDSLQLRLYNPLKAGITWLYTKIGNDGNTLLSECGVQMPEYDSIAILVVDTAPYFQPAFQSINCDFGQLVISFPQAWACNTIAANASDFQLHDATGTLIPIQSINVNCPPGNPLATQSVITFNFAPGTTGVSPLYLTVKNGSDLNTIANACGTLLSIGDTIAIITVNTFIPVNLGNDITACSNQPPVLNSGVPGVTYTWYLNGNLLPDNTQSITATQSGTYVVVLNNGPNCSGTDTINVTLVAPPSPSLGNDIGLCASDPLPLLDCGVAGALSYQWLLNGVTIGGASGQTYQVQPGASGTYVCIVSSAPGCNGSDTIQVTIDPNLPVNLGNDITICANDPLPVLDAGVAAQSYVWYLNGNLIPGATGQTYQATQAGYYLVVATSVSNCTGTDSVQVTINPNPSVSLGPDVSVCITQGFTLDAGNPGATYQWYLNNVLIGGASGQTYTPTQSGTYSVVVTNGFNCTGTASVNVTVYTAAPTPNVQNVAYCSGSNIPVLDAGVTGVSYQWYDPQNNPIPGAINQTYQPTANGTYTVVVSVGTCTASGTGTVTEVQNPTVNALQNQSICSVGGTYPLLNAGNSPGASYQWYDQNGIIAGATSNTYQTTQAGTYTVIATNSQSGVNCTASASMTLTVNQNPVVTVGSDLTICADTTASLFANVTQGTAASYQWYQNGNAVNGATNNNYQAGTSGSYSVIITDANNCTSTDEMQLTVNPLPAVTSITAEPGEFHESHVHVCATDAFPLITLNVSGSSLVYVWYFNSTLLSNTGTTYQVPSGGYGEYMVTITDGNGCKTTADFEIEEEECDPVFHNVITPNGDGNNDQWVIENFDPKFTHQLNIYNRWGNDVYSSSNYQNDWKAADLPDGTYFYLFTYNGKSYNGTIQVIKDKK